MSFPLDSPDLGISLMLTSIGSECCLKSLNEVKAFETALRTFNRFHERFQDPGNLSPDFLPLLGGFGENILDRRFLLWLRPTLLPSSVL